MSQPGNISPTPVAFLVDDEPMLLDMNESVLRGMGFQVRKFRAAEFALEAYRAAERPPEIIITDFAMHKMSGMELLEVCRQMNPGQKVLLVSGTVDASVFRHSAQKPDMFIPKPYPMDEFASAVQQLTGVGNSTAG